MDWDAYEEAERRGLLTPEQSEALAEARRRGLTGAKATVSQRQPAQPARGPNWRGMAGAASINAADTAAFGAFDEITGAIKGGGVLQRESMRRASQGGFPQAVAEGASYFTRPFQAFAQRVSGTESPEVQAAQTAGREGVRQSLETARQDYPVSSIAGGVAGTLPTLLVGGAGGAAARMPVRMLQGGAIGLGTGAGYGYNSGDDGERGMSALMGAGTGALAGVGLPLALKAGGLAGGAAKRAAMSSPAVRGALNAIENEAYRRNLVEFDPRLSRANQLNMSIGVPPLPKRVRPGRSTPRFQPPADALGTRVARMADRAQMTPEQIDARIAQFQADPRGRVMAEVFDDEGIHSAATVARMPGQTRNLATEQMEARNAGQARRLERDLTGQSEVGAVDFLSQRTRDVAEQYLEPVWRTPPTPGDEAIFQHFLRRPEVYEAEAAARRTMQGLIARGRLAPEAMNDPAQVLHYIKMEIADTIQNPLKVKAGVRSTNNANLAAAVDDISTALGMMRPGYSEAMRQLSDAIVPREIAKRMATVRGENPNIAASIARNPDIMRDIERVGLNDFGRAVTEESRLYRNANRMIPSTNSQTAPIGASMADEMAMSGGNARPGMGEMVNMAFAYLRNSVNENQRNQFGRFLFRVVDDPNSGLTPQERQAIVAELARIQRARAAQTAATRAGAAGAATQSSNTTR